MALATGSLYWSAPRPDAEWMDLGLPPWAADAACKEHPKIDFVPRGGRVTIARAKAVCRRCLVREECLDYALADDTLVGVFGGTTQKEGRQYRKERSRTHRRGPRPRW
jgi:WhiB family redox-sensing transcriptional regulator